MLINTADYCQTTALEVSYTRSYCDRGINGIDQLEEKIREKINDEYKEKITFQAERDLFVRFACFATLSFITSKLGAVSYPWLLLSSYGNSNLLVILPLELWRVPLGQL